MTLEFQEEIFRFVLQTKEGRKYLPLLDNSIYDLPEHQVIFDLVQKYHEKYAKAPSRANLLEWFDRASKKVAMDVRVYEKVEDSIRQLYRSFNSDTGQIRDRIVEFAQYKLTKNMFKEYSGKISDGDEVFQKIQVEMNKIVQLGQDITEGDNNRGGAILKEYKGINRIEFDGKPCYLNGLNKMTSAKGFHSPQLIILMGGPKSFKSGNLIKMGVEYMRDGYQVYYADAENGLSLTKRRIYQAMLECTFKELYDEDMQKTLAEMIERYKLLGGEMEVGYYPSGVKTIQDVEMELEHLREEKGFIPDIILWDDPDNFLSTDSNKRKEVRHNLHGVYVDIINLNNKLDAFSMGISQVNRNAIGRAVIDMKDFSEDINKARKCHAAFAICRTEEELANGTARIIPVLQRDGLAYKGVNQCLIEIDESRMLIKEIDFKEAIRQIKRRAIKDE